MYRYIMNVLDNIRKLRLDRGWSEYQLAEKSQLPQSTISSWYRKDILPSITSLEKICNAFNMTIAQFFSSSSSVELTEIQKSILYEINKLSIEQQKQLLCFLKTLHT